MVSMMMIVKACFSNIRSGRLRAFAFARLETSQCLCFADHYRMILRLVSQNIRSGRLSAFAFARLESICCFYPSLDILRLVSQNIRSGRLSAFAFARLESICCFYPSLDVVRYCLLCYHTIFTTFRTLKLHYIPGEIAQVEFDDGRLYADLSEVVSSAQ
ncbi:hypothetical protein H5410_023466, partial [Solanum commersonii]